MIELSISDTIILAVLAVAILFLLYDRLQSIKPTNIEDLLDLPKNSDADPFEIPVHSNFIKFSVEEQMDLEESIGWDGILYQSTIISPFSVHLANHMSSKPISLDQLDKVNVNFLGALEGLASEIENKLQVPSSVKVSVSSEKTEDDFYLLGSLSFNLDKYHPGLYSISICLFLDGFEYNAASNTYTLKSKISLI